jgi:hypothetical protein
MKSGKWKTKNLLIRKFFVFRYLFFQLSNGFFERFVEQLIETDVFCRGEKLIFTMNFRFQTKDEFSRKLLFRRDVFLGGLFEKYFQTRFAFFAKIFDAVGVKIRAAVQADEFAAKHLDFRVEN